MVQGDEEILDELCATRTMIEVRSTVRPSSLNLPQVEVLEASQTRNSQQEGRKLALDDELAALRDAQHAMVQRPPAHWLQQY